MTAEDEEGILGPQVRFGAPEFERLARDLERFDPLRAISAAAGLLTVPEYHPQTLRIETFLHLACIHCNGRKRPNLSDFRRWLGDDLGGLELASLEDPPEDVFVSNVIAAGGNYRIFEGTWESSDYPLQDVLSCLGQTEWGRKARSILPTILGLLRVSDNVAERAALKRWTPSPESAPRRRFLKSRPRMEELVARVGFKLSELTQLGVVPETLGPFLLQPRKRQHLLSDVLGHSTLERYPLIRFQDTLICACPTAISPAIRRFVLEWLVQEGELDEFSALLRERHRRTLFTDVALQLQLSADEWTEETLEVVPHGGPPIVADSGLVPFDGDKLALLVLLHDDLEFRHDNGLSIAGPLETHLADFLEHQAAALSEKGIGGLALVVWAGIGGGNAVALPYLPEGWTAGAMGLADLEMFSRAENASFLRLWKLLADLDAVEAAGVHVGGFPALLNTYAFWEHRAFRLVPPEVPYPGERSLVYVPPNFVETIRVRERERLDRHAAPLAEGGPWLAVERYHRSAFFPSMTGRPVYAAPDMARRSELCAVVERPGFRCWVWSARPDLDRPPVEFLFRIWQALLEWIDRLADALLETRGEWKAPVHLKLELSDPEKWAHFLTAAGNDPPVRPTHDVDFAQREVRVLLPFACLGLFRRASNDGERALLETAVRGLLALEEGADRQELAALAEELVARCMDGPDRRSVHLFQSSHGLDHLGVPEGPFPRMAQPEDMARWALGLAWRAKRAPEPGGVEGAAESVSLLNSIVAGIWAELAHRLQALDGRSLVLRALANNEAISRDRDQWRRTARAVIALHDEEEATAAAGIRESDRAQAALAGRVLVEMGVATCARDGGQAVSWAEFDHLLAGAVTLIGVASDSDAIHSGFADPHVEVLANGELLRDRSFMAEVGHRHVQSTFGRGFREAATQYDSFFQDPEEGSRGSFSADFSRAFEAEYHLNPHQWFEGLGELFDMAAEGGDAVVATTRGEITARLRDNRGFLPADVDALLDWLCLPKRDQWDVTPGGFEARDWYPWVYRRRLALSLRPLVVVGSEADATILYGTHQLAASVSYLYEGIQDAWFPTTFFRSTAMRSYRGKRAHELGHAFATDVASAMRELGWHAELEVQMKSMGAPSQLGDLDVVCWRANDRRLLLVECKRLQPARTTGEVVELLGQFRGESGDSLAKHLRRVAWVRDHLPQLRQRLDIPHSAVEATELLVTNAAVPMQFLKDLPISPTNVIPITDLSSLIVPEL